MAPYFGRFTLTSVSVLNISLLFLSSIFITQGLVTLELEVNESKLERILHEEAYTISYGHSLSVDSNVPLKLLQYAYNDDEPAAIVPDNGIVVFVRAFCEDEVSFEEYQPKVVMEMEGEKNCDGSYKSPKLTINVEDNIDKMYTVDDSVSQSRVSAVWDWDVCDHEPTNECCPQENVMNNFIKQVTLRVSKSHSLISRGHSKISFTNESQPDESKKRRAMTLSSEAKCTGAVDILYDACWMDVVAKAPVVSSFLDEERSMTVLDEDQCTKDYLSEMEFLRNTTVTNDSNSPVLINELDLFYYIDNSISCQESEI